MRHPLHSLRPAPNRLCPAAPPAPRLAGPPLPPPAVRVQPQRWPRGAAPALGPVCSGGRWRPARGAPEMPAQKDRLFFLSAPLPAAERLLPHHLPTGHQGTTGDSTPETVGCMPHWGTGGRGEVCGPRAPHRPDPSPPGGGPPRRRRAHCCGAADRPAGFRAPGDEVPPPTALSRQPPRRTGPPRAASGCRCAPCPSWSTAPRGPPAGASGPPAGRDPRDAAGARRRSAGAGH